MRVAASVLLAVALLIPATTLARDTSDCKVEPASQWAPQGFICPPLYGVGDASRYPGSGVARNDCVWPFTACVPIRVTNLANGRSIVVTPVTWCMCWVGVTGPSGETERIIDLDPASVAALGLDWERGMFRDIIAVEPVSGERGEHAVTPATQTSVPDTALR